MKKILFIIFSFLSIGAYAQIIDFDNFNETLMNQIMFDEMNKRTKQLHNGDSLIWSSVIQEDIMTDNYNYIKIHALQHNPKWIQVDLPDSIKVKINNEILKYSNFKFLTTRYTYSEIIGNVTFWGYDSSFTYQRIATEIINGWKNSPPHKSRMDANYMNKVLVGVITYYDKKRRTVYVSFVHIS